MRRPTFRSRPLRMGATLLLALSLAALPVSAGPVTQPGAPEADIVTWPWLSSQIGCMLSALLDFGIFSFVLPGGCHVLIRIDNPS